MDNIKDEEDLLQKLKDIFEEAFKAQGPADSYPTEALPRGTYVRSTRLDKLGIITDAFYGDVDEVGTKIIVYTVLLFPSRNLGITSPSGKEKIYISNEYEYEIIGYLMIPPANIKNIAQTLGGGLFL